MKYIFVGELGLGPSNFVIYGDCAAQIRVKNWPHDEDARRRVAAVVITLLNESTEITHVVAGVFNEQGQICAAHATHDLVMLSPKLHCRADDLIFQVVKVPPFDCACFDGQPASAGAFACSALHLRHHGPPTPQLLTVDLTHTQGA